MGKIWSPDRKFWSPTYLIYNLHKNMTLNDMRHLSLRFTFSKRSSLLFYSPHGKQLAFLATFHRRYYRTILSPRTVSVTSKIRGAWFLKAVLTQF